MVATALSPARSTWPTTSATRAPDRGTTSYQEPTPLPSGWLRRAMSTAFWVASSWRSGQLWSAVMTMCSRVNRRAFSRQVAVRVAMPSASSRSSSS